jgi:hypothetical protein
MINQLILCIGISALRQNAEFLIRNDPVPLEHSTNPGNWRQVM